MAEISAFQCIHYNRARCADLGGVICPPYDVIPPQMQQALYERDEHNYIRLEASRELPQDSPGSNRYTRARATLDAWLTEGVLETDIKPALYVHDHEFTQYGRRFRRRGLTVLVRLEEWDRMAVRPHEGTLKKPKGDRLSLLWALEANASPIFSLYHDPEKSIQPLLEAATAREPRLEAADADGESHTVWAVDDEKAIAEICARLAPMPIYIADGHHRYESALAFRNEKRVYVPTISLCRRRKPGRVNIIRAFLERLY